MIAVMKPAALLTLCTVLFASCSTGKITVIPAGVDVHVDGARLSGQPQTISGASTLCQKNTRQLDFFVEGKKVGTRVYVLELSGAALVLGLFTGFLSTAFWAFRFPDKEYDLRAMAGAVRLKLPVGISLSQGTSRLSINTGMFGEIRYFDSEPASEIVIRATALSEKGQPTYYPGRSAVASCRLQGPIRSGDAQHGGCNSLWFGTVHCMRVDEVRITFENGKERVLTRADFADLPIDDCRTKLNK